MVKDVSYFSCISKRDFTKFLMYPLTYVEGTPSVNQWNYDSSLEAMHLNVDNTQRGYIGFTTHLLYPGDIIETEADFLNVSGIKGKIGIDHSATANFSSYSNVEMTQSKSQGNFETFRNKFIVQQKGYYRILVGAFLADVTELYMRDVICKVYQKQSNSQITKELKAVLTKNSSGTFSPNVDFVNDPCAVTIGWGVNAGDTVTITFDESLPKKPISFVNNGYYLVDNKYIARTAYADVNKVSVRFYPLNPVSDIPVKIENLPNGATLEVLLKV